MWKFKKKKKKLTVEAGHEERGQKPAGIQKNRRKTAQQVDDPRHSTYAGNCQSGMSHESPLLGLET